MDMNIDRGPDVLCSISGPVKVTGPPNVEFIGVPHNSRETILPQKLLTKVANFVQQEMKISQEPNCPNDPNQDTSSQKDISDIFETHSEFGCHEEGCEKTVILEDHGGTISQKKNKKIKKKNRKRCKGKDDLKSNISQSQSSKRPRKISPNYFVAVQVTNKQIHKKVEEMQKFIEEQEPKLAPAFIPLPTLHFTLMVMHLSKADKIRAKSALDKCLNKLKKLRMAPITLDIAGTGNFRNGVVFAKINPGEELDKLGCVEETVRQSFEEEGMLSTDERGFKPHLTILKVSRSPKLFKQGIKKIDPNLYELYEQTHFGTQLVDCLQLCSMHDKKDEDGYYSQIHSGTFRDDLFKFEFEKELCWNFKKPEDKSDLNTRQENKMEEFKE